MQWKLPTKLSSFVQRAGRAARRRDRTGLAILLVEPSAYSVRPDDDKIKGKEKEAGRGNKKSRRKEKKAAKREKRGEYARLRGRYRGGRSCDDTIHDLEAPDFDPNDLTEGLYAFVQTTKCRRLVLQAVFDNPKPSESSP